MDDDTTPDVPRTAEEIARRAIALHCTVAAAHGVCKDDLKYWLKQERLWKELTPRELRFFANDPNSKEEIIWMTWMVEALVPLLWSIGKLNELPKPNRKYDTGLVISAIPGLFESTSHFIESAILRSREEIKREEEYLYDIHCQVDQTARKDNKAPDGFDGSVVFFRHYGLCWVRGYCGQSWDEVTPDT